MTSPIPKPPDSPQGDVAAWRLACREYVNASWEQVEEEISRKETEIRLEAGNNGSNKDDPTLPKNKNPDEEKPTYCKEDDLAEVEGELPQLVEEGPRVMVSIRLELRHTRYGPKDYLYWCTEDGSLKLLQFFQHYEKYPANSKAVQNYIVAMGARPKRLDRINLRKMIGLRAEVQVETAKPTFNAGSLKGKPKPESLHYSEVSQILRPLERVDPQTLKQLREKS